jgi:hypothetical protein
MWVFDFAFALDFFRLLGFFIVAPGLAFSHPDQDSARVPAITSIKRQFPLGKPPKIPYHVPTIL